jgi:penicillin amidase
MRWVRRLFNLLITLVVLAVAAIIVLGGLLTSRGLPQVSGTIKVGALHAPVTVIRDRAGIIQITADDPHDLFVAQGYAHAQERMWQMELSRRIGAGRLAELFGESQVDTDRYIRTLGWRVAAERDLKAMSPAGVAVLQAYADGVNAWITEHEGRLSTPFVVAGLLAGSGGLGGFTLEPWTTLDTATWQKVQAWSLGGDVDVEIFRLLADARLKDPARTDELFPAYDVDAPVITPTGLPGSGGAGAAPANPQEPGTPATPAGTSGARPNPIALSGAEVAGLANVANLGNTVAALAGFDRGAGLVGSHGVGSNNWVVAGAHTASGKPMLANDPHLGFSMPSVWIMNGLHCRVVGSSCPWDVAGVSFPGFPAVILGHNAHIAWGATNLGPDTQDLFRETVNPDDSTKYKSGGRWVPFDLRHETIKVAGGEEVELDVRSTVHGVVLSDVDNRLKDGPPLALRWTTTVQADRTLESFLAIDVATTFDEFRASFDTYGSPSQNFIYADIDGHIGYVLPGLIPVRAEPCPPDALCVDRPATGERVRDGASGEEEWTGYLPREALPWQLDPPSGVIVSANNAPVDGAFPYWFGRDWDPGYRAARVADLLESIPAGMTADDLRSIQGDTYVLRADTIVPALRALDPKPSTEDGKLLLDRIVTWNRECDETSSGCAAYISAELMLQRAIFDDELGPIARDYVDSPMAWQALIWLLGEPGDRWWDDTSTTEVETAGSIIGPALDRTAAQLRAALGEPTAWTWDRLHRVTFRETTLGSSGIGPLEWYFDPPGRAVGGADGAIVKNSYATSRMYPDPYDPSYQPVGIDRVFEVTNGPSMRFSIDMDDLDAARIIITTGQSGNPFDGHYGDLIGLWAVNLTIALPFSHDAVAGSAVSTLTLEP